MASIENEIFSSFFKGDYWTPSVVETRKKHVQKIMNGKNTVPVICKSKTLNLKSEKLMVPRQLNMGQLRDTIKRRSKIIESEAIFIFVNGTVIPNSTSLVEQVWEQYKKEDDIVYIIVSKENTFGTC